MTLQRKFAALLTVLAAVVLINVGAALYTLNFLESRGAQWREIQEVQTTLNRIKRQATRQVSLWVPGFPLFGSPRSPEISPEVVATFRAARAEIEASLALLEQIEEFRVRIGMTSANLRRRIEVTQRLGSALLDETSGDPTGLAQEFFDLHELIEKIEFVVINHAYEEAKFGGHIRPYLLIVLAGSLVGTVLAGVLGVVLVRRWVVRPVGYLRSATERLSRGDFTHRVPVEGTDELGKLSAEVNHMASMISTMQDERVDRERLAAVGEMVRRLAHNLRNPLAGIRSLAELTRADLPADSPGHETQSRIVHTVDRFERWLSDLLGATTPLSVSPQPTDVASFVRTLVEPLKPLATDRGVALTVTTAAAPSTADFDARHLEQALVGVITNAIQASPRGKAVEVLAQMCEDGQSWEVRIADQGPGVPKELVEKIFRPYFTTKRDGTGIGLAVAKQIVEQHRGRIWVENGPDRAAKGLDQGSGSVFIIRLPLANSGDKLANNGQVGARRGEDPDRRGRSESSVFDPANAPAGRA